MSALTSLANRFGTDKGTTVGAAHGYTLVYDMLMAPMRQRERVDVLELGLAIGGPELGGDADRRVSGSPSLNLWLAYFSNASVVGFDISDFSHIKRDRFRFVHGDAGRQADLEKIVALNQCFDVIIDDASHASFHQQLALANLFKLLKPGGLYILEDLSWQPTHYEATLPGVKTTAKLLVDFQRNGEMRPSPAVSPGAALELKQSVSAVLLFEESTLNAGADNYNRRLGELAVKRTGWRSRFGLSRIVDPYFWLFNARHLVQSISGRDFAVHQTIKLAVLQKIDDARPR